MATSTGVVSFLDIRTKELCLIKPAFRLCRQAIEATSSDTVTPKQLK